MDSYIATQEFSTPYLGTRVYVGDAVGKIASREAVIIVATEYANEAFYDWVGTSDSLNYLSFVGVLPDPPAPGVINVKGGSVSITSGASVVTVAGAAWGFVPSGIAVV